MFLNVYGKCLQPCCSFGRCVLERSQWAKIMRANESSQVSPKARRQGQCKGGGGKNLLSTTVQPAASLSEDLETLFTQPTNEGKTIAEHPIGPHFLQQFPNCPKLCTCVTFPVQRPKLVVGAHGKDTLEVVASQVLFSPSVRQVCNVV